MKIRRAKIADAKDIQKLVNTFAARGEMLPRSLSEIYENIRDYFVCENEDGEVVGVAALHVMWEDLAEIRSLAVAESAAGSGVGTRLARACLREARGLGVKMVFALTYRVGFFLKLGFEEVDKATLPQKIWTDCLKCSKFPDCDESAVVYRLENRKKGEKVDS